jgi:hypothetical protein
VFRLTFPLMLVVASFCLAEPVAESNRVELGTLTIQRIAYGKANNVRSMILSFVCYYPSSPSESSKEWFLLEMKDLSVVDELGHVLSLKAKDENGNELLKTEVSAKGVSSQKSKTEEKYGPNFELRLDAPARAATKLKELKAKLRVTRAARTEVTIKGVSKFIGKELQDKGLQGVKAVPIAEPKDYGGMYTSFWVKTTGGRDRVKEWHLMKNGKLWKEDDHEHTLGSYGEPERARMAWPGILEKDVDLVLFTLVPIDSHEFVIDMKDVELP